MKEYILKKVSEITGVAVSEMVSKKRGKVNVSETRQLFMLACRSKRMTQSEIGNFIGRTHSDVSNGLKSIQGKIEVYKDLRETFERIMGAI